ncbi:hypothetical protein NDU88_006047 [Pleurodeles waltl]|uniref:Uncharacterized protein n=1 Tax=Pleurodeles waltl TaxID=8319 RepID=A0AAV7TW08_PLEWA|nr:hypothetical protein NDU88_006047 [Pleurodeles waltl]
MMYPADSTGEIVILIYIAIHDRSLSILLMSGQMYDGHARSGGAILSVAWELEQCKAHVALEEMEAQVPKGLMKPVAPEADLEVEAEEVLQPVGERGQQKEKEMREGAPAKEKHLWIAANPIKSQR